MPDEDPRASSDDARPEVEELETGLELLDFGAGVVGGCAGIFVGHPFDLIKTRMQADSAGTLKHPVDAVKLLLRNEGARALFKGIETPLLGNVPIQAVVFGVYGASLRNIAGYSNEDWTDREQPLMHHFIAGVITGIVQTPMVTVCDFAKVQMQVQTAKANKGKREPLIAGQRMLYKNSVDCALSVARHQGAHTLFRGTAATLARDLTYGQYFATYEGLKRLFVSWSGESNNVSTPIASALAGGLSGLTGWLLIYPIDAVKTRLQAHPAELPKRRTFDVIREMAKERPHYGAFTRGLGVTLIRSVPVNMVTFLFYELIISSKW
mmetsp:Transcript_44921/g.105810  ORF Transcript_44921/g.105810 Transcript_44921/m.105810 type:complete len:323 (-) Transcript_44921:45-1013(-)